MPARVLASGAYAPVPAQRLGELWPASEAVLIAGMLADVFEVEAEITPETQPVASLKFSAALSQFTTCHHAFR
jgi:hypothetical protein